MNDIPDQLRNDVQQLQALQQQLQGVIAQRQQLELQLAEVKGAMDELEKIDENTPVYKSIGTILVKVRSREEIKKELADQREVLDYRTNSLKKQEEVLNGKISPLAQRVSQGLQKYGGGSYPA